MSLGSLKRKLRTAREVAKLIQAELTSKTKVPIRRRFGLWRKGFLSQAPIIYRWDDNQASRAYVSDYGRNVLAARINSDNTILGNKLACHFLIKSVLGDISPRLLAVARKGQLYPVDVPSSDLEGWLASHVSAGESVITKPIVGAKGRGVRRFSDWPKFRSWMQDTDGGLVYETVIQHEYANAIFPHSVNTIRFVTMVDEEGPFLAASVHRFGTSASSPVDNWSAGGLSAAIDPDSGRIGAAAPHPKHTGWKMRWFEEHPDTKAPIVGVEIPRWRELLESILAFAGRLSFLPYLAWDVAITPDGWRVIEINGNSDVDLLQIHGPLLDNDRVRNFYRAHGVV